MEKNLNNSVVHNSPTLKESESDKSFVGKVKSILHNTPLSKWFQKQNDNRPVVRRREESFVDEDISEIQPPSKRVKLPSSNESNNYNSILFNDSFVPTAHSASNNGNTFNQTPEPVAGPSGIKPHKLLTSTASSTPNNLRSTVSNNELLNGHSDSEESTSGYSSVARTGSKEQVCASQESSKHASPLQSSPSNIKSLFHKPNTGLNRSLFADRSLSPSMHTSLSSRRPNFNASTFGSPSFVDKTIATKRAINSPFYNGKTVYGGASAYGRGLNRRSQDFKRTIKGGVDIKPANTSVENPSLVMGKTARRILDTIEQYSSPISDAKKIPIVSKKMRTDGLLTRYTGANPYLIQEKKVSSNTELQVPTVPELLKMKARLQDSTEAVRQLATSSKSDLNTEFYNITSREEEKEKHTSKIKNKITSVRQKHTNINETVKEVNLTPVSLPLTTLPKFDFVIPPAKNVAENSPQTSKSTEEIITFKSPNPNTQTVRAEVHVQKEKSRSNNSTEYTFSDPVVVAENVKTVVAINDFKFSEPPPCTKNKTDHPKNACLNFKMPEKNSLTSLVPNKKTNSVSPVKTASMLKTGSVMDILGKTSNTEKSLMEKFKPAEGTWECTTCLIRNKLENTRCAACETPKAGTEKKLQSNNFGSQFKLSSGKWECSSCLLHNNNSESKCVSCTTPKPGSQTEVEQNKKNGSISSGFGDKFKLSSDTWECATCMIRNKNDLTKCAACETPNPKSKPTGSETQSSIFGAKIQPSSSVQSGFGNAFKAKNDEWECSTCMVRNKASNAKCLCCETPNPNSTSSTATLTSGISKDKTPVSTFNFGIDKAAATSFSFGIPPAAANSVPNTQATSIFGGNVPATTNTTEKFSFGIPTSTRDKPKTTESTPTTVVSSTDSVPTTSNPLLKRKETLPEKTVTDPKASETTEKSSVPLTTAVSSVGFTLKPTVSNGEVNSNIFGSKTTSTVSSTSTANTPAAFTFGTKPAAVAAPLPTPQPSQPEPSNSLFKFGSGSSNAGNPFGSANAPSNVPTTTPTPSFGTSNSTPSMNSTEIKPFTFSSAPKDAPEQVNKAPMFQFGQTASASGPQGSSSAKAPAFNFASSTTTPAFNFTGGKGESSGFNATPTNNIFGGASTSTNQNGTFNFGNMAASNSNQKAGFSFGAAVSSTNPSTTQTGFNFGASTSTFAQSSGGFNFSEAVPAFNASAKPLFNFTDGNVTAFSAQPSTEGGLTAPRKMRRAVRRTQR